MTPINGRKQMGGFASGQKTLLINLIRGFLTPYFYAFFGPTIVDTWMHLVANGSKLGDFTLFRGLINQPTG